MRYRPRGPAGRTATIGALLCALAASPVRLAGQQLPADTAPRGQGADTAQVRLDFQEADIRAVISALAELMGTSVSYGQLPARTVTLKTFAPISRDSLRAVFLGLLESNGLTAEESAGVLRIAEAPREREGQRQTGQATPGERGLFVIRLKHAHAGEAAAAVNALFGQAGGGFVGAPGLSEPGLSEGLRRDRVPPGLPEPEGEAPRDAQEAGAAELEGEITIVPDITTNSLLVRATQHDFEVIQGAVELIDVRPRQVLIEVLVAEARRDALTKIGFELFVSNAPSGDDPTIEGTVSERVLGNIVARVMHLDGWQVDALVEALSTSSDVKILSRPVLVTANNQEAQILVGSERPFIQVSRALPTDAAVRDQIVQYRDVGTKLSILPTINADGYVNLIVRQEVSAATAETQFGAPVISSREASTRLLVRDGQTAVIGGLIDRQRERVRSGIPLLKDIPLLGALFGSTSWRSTETELFLFLTPTVLETDADVDGAREAVRQGAPEISKRVPVPLVPPDSASGTER